jgi:plastocyanin domain-containing protein
MTQDQIIITILGVFLIAFIYRYFLGKKEKVIEASGEVDIKVEGGYTPEVISIPKGKTTKINFLRTDATDCLEEVVLGDFKVRKHLPLNEKISIELTPQKTGEFKYSCGMNMYHGKIIVS